MTLLSAVVGKGTLASRPAAGMEGRLYFATDSGGGQWTRDTGTAWEVTDGGGGGSSSLSSASAQLSADVTMTSASTYYDGPSVSLAAGTWLVCAVLTVLLPAGGHITGKLWDGTTASASAQQYQATSGGLVVIPIAWIVTPTSTTTYKVSCASNVGSNVIKAAANVNGAGNNASSIVAVKIA